ncbi:hypothetical protein [Sphingomonas echinoides]|uniref:hypothetical protein n=1 Tax=Sphingomonas echinoides TaxID=59803 RepID=UPI002413B101|nr:hypothetical protein [Sphingomonas echinoides]
MATHAPNTGAPLSAPFNQTSPASTVSPFRIAEGQYRTAVERFEGLPQNLEREDKATFDREHDQFIAAVNAVDEAPVADWSEFATAFEIACDLGQSIPSDNLVSKLLADVRRLSDHNGMKTAERAALETLNSRFDHTAAIARIIGMHDDLPADITDAIRGVGDTLDELCGRMDAILNPVARENGQ